MKTVEEYWKENAVYNGTVLLNPTQLMEGYAKLYHAQFKGVCKWQGDFPDCTPFGYQFKYSESIVLIYCPFCGRKIERI